MACYEDYATWKNWSGSFAFNASDDAYFSKEVGHHVESGDRVLEIGFGDGHFLQWARERGAEVFGIEIQPVLLEAARRNGVTVFSSLDDIGPDYAGTFDCVIAFDVLEHLESDAIQNLLRTVATLMKKDCVFVMRVPNGYSPFLGMSQYSDMTHVSIITPLKMTQLCVGTGLEVRSYRNVARVAEGGLLRRCQKHIQFGLRDIVSSCLSAIYGLKNSAMDANIVIELVAAKANETP